MCNEVYAQSAYGQLSWSSMNVCRATATSPAFMQSAAILAFCRSASFGLFWRSRILLRPHLFRFNENINCLLDA